jgi:hypothetical protein
MALLNIVRTTLLSACAFTLCAPYIVTADPGRGQPQDPAYLDFAQQIEQGALNLAQPRPLKCKCTVLVEEVEIPDGVRITNPIDSNRGLYVLADPSSCTGRPQGGHCDISGCSGSITWNKGAMKSYSGRCRATSM